MMTLSLTEGPIYSPGTQQVYPGRLLPINERPLGTSWRRAPTRFLDSNFLLCFLCVLCTGLCVGYSHSSVEDVRRGEGSGIFNEVWCCNGIAHRLRVGLPTWPHCTEESPLLAIELQIPGSSAELVIPRNVGDKAW